MTLSPLTFRLVLIFTLTLNLSLAQTKEIDSLQNLLKTATDTTEVNVLRFLGQRLRSHNMEKALEYLSKSVEKSKQIGFDQGEILGVYSIALTYGMTGSYAESLDYLNKCLVLAIDHNDYKRVNYVYNSMGIVYKRIGDYPTSQSYYLKRIELVDSLQLDQDTSTPYLNLGILYDLMGEQDKAIESYEKALEVYKGPDREDLENNVVANLGLIDFQNKDYEAALDKFLKTTVFHLKKDNNIILSTRYSEIGNCYLELGQFGEAQNYYLKSLELARKLSMKQQIAEIYHGLANLMFHQNRYADAIDYSNKSLQAVALSGGYKQKREAHEMAYTLYEATGQLSKAIHHLNQTMAYKDSLLNETKVKEIQNLQIQHEVYLKDREIKENELQLALLNTQIALNNRRLVYMGIITLLMLFSASLLYYRYQSKIKVAKILQQKNFKISQQKEVIEDMNTQLEKRILRAQMNPHFIFNSLSSIRYLISSNDKESALAYLNKFSKLLRQVLETSINVSLVLHEEIDLLKIYVELEALRFDNTFSYTFNIDKNLNLYQYEVPMLLVQPYIENAILHGLLPKEGPKNLVVSFKNDKEHIMCIIEDNGVGINPSNTQGKLKKRSRGMSITEKRINALKKFSAQKLVKVENLGNGNTTGTRVTILMPKEQ